MELIESFGLTLADINNLVRHAISAADNVHPHNYLNTFTIDTPQGQATKVGSQSPLLKNCKMAQKDDGQIKEWRTSIDREVKVGASVLTEKGNIYQGSNFEQPSSLFAQSPFGGSPWASSGSGIGDDRVFIQAEDCAIMKAMIDGNTHIRAIAVHVKHLVPSLNAQHQAVQQMFGFMPPPFGAGQFGGFQQDLGEFELTPKSMHEEFLKQAPLFEENVAAPLSHDLPAEQHGDQSVADKMRRLKSTRNSNAVTSAKLEEMFQSYGSEHDHKEVKKKFSPRLKNHMVKQLQEQALFQSANTPFYIPILQLPIGKWRNNLLFNRVSSQLADWQATNAFSAAQSTLQSPKFPPSHHFLMILCFSETSYVLKTSASIMSQNQVQNLYTNSFISPSLNLGYHSFFKLPGQPLMTPRGSLNVANTKFNLTGYRRESERLNFPSSMNIHNILDSAVFWTQIDHNQETRREVESLLIQDNFRELTKIFKRRLRFNKSDISQQNHIETYAIKSKIGAGFSKINPVTLQQFAHGLLEFMLHYQPRHDGEEHFLKQELLSNQVPFSQLQMQELLANKGIVLGYDSKTRSCTIAKLIAAVLKKFGGVQIHWIDKFTTQAFLEYYTKTFGCMLGIMISCEQNCVQSLPTQGANALNQMGSVGPQSSSTSDKQNQFNHDCTDQVKIHICDAWGKPLNHLLREEIKLKMEEFILNNISLPDLSSVFDYSAWKLKFNPSNFTDITLRKYIGFMEKNFLIDKQQNSSSPKYLVAFSCFQGPVSYFIKKVMANFDFKSPFTILDVQGTEPFQTEFLQSNGSSKNVFCPLFHPQVRLQKLIKQAELKKSKLIIQTDPTGSQFVLHEAIIVNEEYEEWRQVSFEEVVVLVLNCLKKKNGQLYLRGKTLIINKSIDLPFITAFCEQEHLKIISHDQTEEGALLKVDFEQNMLKIADGQFDAIALCLVVVQSYSQQLTFQEQVNSSIQFHTSVPISIQNNQAKWKEVIATVKNSNAYSSLTGTQKVEFEIEMKGLLKKNKNTLKCKVLKLTECSALLLQFKVVVQAVEMAVLLSPISQYDAVCQITVYNQPVQNIDSLSVQDLVLKLIAVGFNEEAYNLVELNEQPQLFKPKKVTLQQEDDDVFERPVSKRRKLENIETNGSTNMLKSQNSLFQMPLKSPMRVPQHQLGFNMWQPPLMPQGQNQFLQMPDFQRPKTMSPMVGSEHTQDDQASSLNMPIPLSAQNSFPSHHDWPQGAQPLCLPAGAPPGPPPFWPPPFPPQPMEQLLAFPHLFPFRQPSPLVVVKQPQAVKMPYFVFM